MVSLVGRKRELNVALNAFAGVCKTSSAATLLVAGSSGIGKTALIDAFVEGIPERAHVLLARAYQSDRDVPLALATRLARELRAELDARTRSGRVVLIVEDAHWADEPSLAHLAELRTQFGDRSLLLAFTHADEHARELPFAIDRRVVLSELSADASCVLARRHYASANESVLDAIATRSRGVPYEIVTIARAAQQADAADAKAVEHSASAAIAKGLATMRTEQRTLLQLLSLLPEPAEFELIERLVSERSNLDAIVLSLEPEYLARSGNYLCFSHELTAAAVLETIAMKIPLHRRIIEALERGGLKDGKDRQRLAEHALASGDRHLASRALLDLALASARDGTTHLIVWASERYMKLDEPPADRFVDFYSRFFEALTHMRRNEQALSVASHALSEAQRRGIRGLGALAGQLIRAQWAVDRRDAAKASFERYTRAFVDPVDLQQLREAAVWENAG
jgi:AAA ATPase domain